MLLLMAQNVPISFAGGSAPGATSEEGGAIFTNAYAEMTSGPGKSPVVYKGTEGRKFYTQVSETGPCRALFVHNGALYAVIGRVIATIKADGDTEVIGGLATDGHVTFAVNQKGVNGQICVTGGGLSQIFEDGALTRIDDVDLPPAIDVCAIDGFFVWTIADGRLFSSSLNEGQDVSALDFSSANVSPDRNVRGIARGRELIVFGENSMQPFSNDGGEAFPFVPIPGASRGVGCGAAATALVLNAGSSDTLVWVDHNGIVKATPAYDGQRISDHDVERAIANDPKWHEMTATTYTREGHVFYVLSGSNFTYVYDFATGEWHNRVTEGHSRWNGSSIVRFTDKLICGDAVNGSLYELDPDTYTDAGKNMIMSIQAPMVHQFPNRLCVYSITVDVLAGRGLNTTDDHNADPKLMLEVSKDGGHTWGQYREAKIGKIGEYRERCRINRLGMTGQNGFIPKFSISAAVARGFVAGASANVKLLAP